MSLPPLPPPRAHGVDVVTFGESSLDFVGVGPAVVRSPAGKVSLSSFDVRPGGQAATAAVGCARQGLASRYVGVFGHDGEGQRVRDALVREAVDVVAIERRDAASRVALILVDDATGERVVLEHRSRRLDLDPDEIPFEALLAGRVLFVDGTDAAAATVAAARARAAGIPTVVDVDRVGPEIAGLLSHIDVIVVPETFPESFTGVAGVGAAVAAMAASFDGAVIIATLGAGGSLARDDSREIRTAGYDTHAVDTTGAGDAFRAGLMSGWIRLGGDAGLPALLEHANATAALNCGGIGAQTALPRFDDVRRLVTERGAGQSK